jgi:hypothetical protein
MSASCEFEHSFLVKELPKQDSFKEAVTPFTTKRKECDGRMHACTFLQRLI